MKPWHLLAIAALGYGLHRLNRAAQPTPEELAQLEQLRAEARASVSIPRLRQIRTQAQRLGDFDLSELAGQRLAALGG